jgi:hypothetical protein
MADMFDLADISGPIPLQQSAAFACALDLVGLPPQRLGDGTLVMRRRLGPLALRMIARPRPASAADLHDLLGELPGRGPVILSPDRPLDLSEMGALPVMSPASVAEIDLARPVEEMLAAQHQKWRNRLRHAQAQSLQITRQNLPNDPAHWLLALDHAQQKARGYRSWPMALTLAFARATPGAAKLFTASCERAPVAAILILRHGAAATYHIGHAGEAGRRTSAHNLLMWEAMLWARAKGVRRLDLGTLDSEREPGLARFKLGTGAQVRALGGTWLWWPPATRLLRPLVRLDRRLMRLS